MPEARANMGNVEGKKWRDSGDRPEKVCDKVAKRFKKG